MTTARAGSPWDSPWRHVWWLCLAAAVAAAGEPPSRFGVDAPQLAALGADAVGTRVLHLVQHGQIDALTYDAHTGRALRRDRELWVDLWYPALPKADAPTAVYAASFPSEPPAPPVAFTVPGIAVRDAAPAAVQRGPGLPLVVVSHGYSNDPAAMTWITENLASKGYVVAAIRHDDPPITDRSRFPELLLRRPLDIVFVVRSLQATLAAEHLVDPSRVALLGYSMGGYGVLTVAGATLDPGGPAARYVPGGLLRPYAGGGASGDALRLTGLRAVVAIAPAGGGALAAWGAHGALGLTAPLLLIAGDQDRTVDYGSGARALFDSATRAPRYLLTFKGAGHSIGLNPPPDAMRTRLWDQDWFADPVWDKRRLNAIEAHFITAFLGRYVKDDASLAAYLAVATPQSSAGAWPPASPPPAYDAYSPGLGEITVWKGFQHNHAAGLELLSAPADGGA